MGNILLMTATEPAQMGVMEMIISFAPFVVVLIAMYFILIRPQRKKEKQTQEMRNNVTVGDTVTTIGGIVGIVVSIKDDTVLVETGADKIKIRFKKWAINEVEKLITE